MQPTSGTPPERKQWFRPRRRPMTAVVTTRKSGRSRVEETCCQPHRTAGFSVWWARRKHMCCPPDWGRYRTPSTLRRASRGMRFGEMRVLSQVFVVVWAAEPQLPGARQGHRGGASAVRARSSMLRPGEKRLATTSCESWSAEHSADAPRGTLGMWSQRSGAVSAHRLDRARFGWARR